MYLFETKVFGLLLLIVSIIQGLIVIFSKGSLRFQKPKGGLIVWIYNITNLLLLVILIPVTAILIYNNKMEILETTKLVLNNIILNQFFEITGLVFFVFGNTITIWARLVLWDSFRLGAVKPSKNDKLIEKVPFMYVRHPMYSSVILISLGIALITKLFLFLSIFIILTICIMVIIPIEEKLLVEAYGDKYRIYREKTKLFLPFII